MNRRNSCDSVQVPSCSGRPTRNLRVVAHDVWSLMGAGGKDCHQARSWGRNLTKC